MAAKQKILIVDDDNNIAELISLYLTKECFDTRIVNDGEEAMIAFDQYNPNLILLDLMLPGMDGYQVCREIRAKANVPIIMLSAKGEIFDKVLGLELGADDYMMKPFDSKELVARVKAVLRRYQPSKPEEPAAELKCVKYTDLVVNLSNYSVIYMGQAVDMPPKELELLYFLAASPNQVFTREQLLDHIWGYEYIGDTRTVDVHVKRLREKIKDHVEWVEQKISISTDYMIRIMDNVTSNIIKYADPGEAVRIFSRKEKDRVGILFENRVRLPEEKVESNGIGIQNIKNMMKKMNGECIVEKENQEYRIILVFPYVN